MPRVVRAQVAWRAGKEMDAFLRQRTWHWVVHQNYTLAADYAIRLLNRHQNDPLGLLLGEIAGKRAGQSTFAEKCAEARLRLCARKGVDDATVLIYPNALPTPDKIQALLRDAQEEEGENDQNEAKQNKKTREENQGERKKEVATERLVVRETAPFAEAQAAVLRCCRRVLSFPSSSLVKERGGSETENDINEKPSVELLEPKGELSGRGLFAARRFPPRQVLLIDDAAFAFRMDEGRCAHCLAPLPRDPFSCPHCQSGNENGRGEGEKYCDRGCQEAAWAQYHACCCASVNPSFVRWQRAMEEVLYGGNGSAKNTNDTNPNSESLDARGALSCLAVAKLCAMATMRGLHPLALPELASLRGVVEYNPPTALAEIGALSVAFSEFFRQPNLFMEEVLSLLALLQTNEFFLPESGGIALFPVLSFLNHSCEPNCAVIQGVSPSQRRLISLRDIRDGEQLFIDYNSHLTSKLDYEHRKALCAQRHFVCFCAKCIRRI